MKHLFLKFKCKYYFNVYFVCKSSPHSSDEKKSIELVGIPSVSMESLKSEVVSWSLASDQKLLEALQSLSVQFADRSQACIARVNELSLDVTTSEVSLRNTFNEFLMLGNSQFIENRVYDDDGEEDEDTTVPSGNDVDPMILMRDGFQAGLGALELFHTETETAKILDIYDRPVPFVIGTECFNNSQSCGLGEEDFVEQEAPETEFVPFDDHNEEVDEIHRKEYDNISENGENQNNFDDEGYGENRTSRVSKGEGRPPLSENDEMEDNAPNGPKSTGNPLKDMLNAQIRNRGSVSAPVSSGQNPNDNDNQSVSAAYSAKPTLSQVHLPEEEEEEEEESGDLFATQDDPYSLFGTSKSTANKFNPKIDRDSLADLFGSSVSAQDDNRDRSASVDSLFGGSSSHGFNGRVISTDMPSNGVKRNSIFGTDDDKLFDEVKTDSKSSVPKMIPIILPKNSASDTKKSTFEEDDVSDGVSPQVVTGNSVAAVKNDAAKNGVRGLGAKDLFGEGLFGKSGGEEDDDLFSQTRINDLGKNKPSVSSAAKFSSLFGDDDDEDESSSLFGKKSMTTPVISSASSSTLLTKPSQSKSILNDDDDDENDDLFGNPLSSNKSSVERSVDNGLKPPEKTAVITARPAVLAKSKSIFDDDDDDDESMLFSSAKSKPLASTVPVADRPVSAVVPATKSSMFDDDEENDGLFKAASSTVSSNVVTSSVPVADRPVSTVVPAKKSSMFDDDEENDGLFKAASSTVSSNVVTSSVPVADRPVSVVVPAKKSSMFDDDDANNNLIRTASATDSSNVVASSVPIAKPIVPMGVPLPLPIKKKSSVFDSDSDDDPLATVTQKSAQSIAVPAETSTTIMSQAPIADNAIVNAQEIKAHVVAETNASIPEHNRFVGAVKVPLPIPVPLSRRVQDSDSDSDSDKSEGIITKSSSDHVKSVVDVRNSERKIEESNDLLLTANIATSSSKVEIVVEEKNIDEIPLASAKVSNGIANRIGGLDPSKIVVMLPGQTRPTSSITSKANLFGDDDEDNFLSKPPTSSQNVSGSGSLASANLNRATVTKNSRKAPTKKKTLFDDDDDDGGLFSSSISKFNGGTATNPSATSKSKSLFDDDDDNFSKSSVKVVEPPISAAVAPASTSLPPTVSFENIRNTTLSTERKTKEEEEKDIFLSKPSSDPMREIIPERDAQSVKSEAVKKSSIFGEESDEESLFGRPVSTKSSAAFPISSVPVVNSSANKFSAPDPMVIAETAPKKSVFEDLEPSNDLFANSRFSAKIAPNVVPTKDPDTSDIPVISTSKKVVSSSLFGEDNDDDLFTSKSSSVIPSKSSPAPSSVPVTISPKPQIKRVFDDDDDDDPLFGVKSNSKPTTSSVSPLPSTTNSNSKKSSLFGDDEDDPLSFGKKSSGGSNKGKSLFDDDD